MSSKEEKIDEIESVAREAADKFARELGIDLGTNEILTFRRGFSEGAIWSFNKSQEILHEMVRKNGGDY